MTERDRSCRIKAAAPSAFRTYIRNYLKTLLTNELLFGFPIQTIGIETNSPLFAFLTRIQDEVHRFAITFHKDKRSKRQIHSELDEIKGIGPTTKEKLLKTFKSVKKIKEANIEELAEVVGSAKANTIREFFETTN